jgi:delta 1-pyrroline-5-carboxylate dehydrogenase
MGKPAKKPPGRLQRIAIAYANLQRARQRWKRTPTVGKVVILAEAADLLLEKHRERRSSSEPHGA